MMTCGRVVAILRGLESNNLQVQANEIDALIKAGAVVEADPDVFFALARIQALRAKLPELDDAMSVVSLQTSLAGIETKLKDEWHRIRASKEEIREEEQLRVAIRFALGQLSDPGRGASLRMLHEQRVLLPDGATYVACPSLGCELYAITHRGRSMCHELELRIGRFDAVAFPVFVKMFDKTYAKMDKFVQNLAEFSQGVPEVRKHRGQILVGLVKSGLSAQDATGTYREMLSQRQPPEVAVTCARNLTKYGRPNEAHHALERARTALQSANFHDSAHCNLNGLARGLLAYDPPESGIPRLVELTRAVMAMFPQTQDATKHAARLMPSGGTAPEVMRRVSIVAQSIAAHPERGGVDVVKVSVALASMTPREDVLPGVVNRFFHLRGLLQQEAGSQPALAADYALECVPCPGTPEEIVSIVRSIIRRVSEQRPPITNGRDTIAMAVAFAKRFAY